MFTDITTLDIVLRATLLSVIALVWVIVVVRIVGLRAFSKMTAFDFIVTVATGSLLAGAVQASDWAAYAQATLAIGALLAVQVVLALVRQSSDTAKEMMQNTPVLLMRDGVINEKALIETRTDRSDLIAKLREANALDFDCVRAVVLETTGDIAVLHGDTLDEKLLEGVRRVD